MTPMVIDELALLPVDRTSLQYRWPYETKRENKNIFVSPSVDLKALELENIEHHVFHQMEISKAAEELQKSNSSELFKGSTYPRFDLAIVSSLQEFDDVVRPIIHKPLSLVRARGLRSISMFHG